MNSILIAAAVVMLLLLFLKVPVFISVLGGAAVYFVFNPGVNPIVFAQQAITGVESISLLAIPFFVWCRYYDELYRRYRSNHGLL